MRIVVTGARGQLGAAVVHECSSRHDVVALDRQALDVTDDRAVESTMGGAHPDVIINCAAYNDVDGAEDDPIKALNVNAFAVRALARAAAAIDAVLVHYSSDFVFDGTASVPYTEEDRPNPRSTYAVSKLLGEWFAADAPRSFVLRVETLFGQTPGGWPPKGTVAGLLSKMKAGEDVKVFHDRTLSPTYVLDAARATLQLIERGAPTGVYHCVNSGRCTWLELGRELAASFGLQPRLVPVRMNDVPLRAPRPLYCALSNQKLLSVGIQMPTWQDAVARYAAAQAQGSRLKA